MSVPTLLFSCLGTSKWAGIVLQSEVKRKISYMLVGDFKLPFWSHCLGPDVFALLPILWFFLIPISYPLSLHLHLHHLDSFHHPCRPNLTPQLEKHSDVWLKGKWDTALAQTFLSCVYGYKYIVSCPFCTGKVNGKSWRYYHVQHRVWRVTHLCIRKLVSWLKTNVLCCRK